MIKWLLVVAVVVMALWWLRRPRARPAVRSAPAPRALPVIVECAHCGVHLPAQDAVHAVQPGGGTLAYCSAAHRDAGPRRAPA